MSGSRRAQRDRGSGTASLAVFLIAVAVIAGLAGYGIHKVTLRHAGSGTSVPAATIQPTAATQPPDPLTGLTADAVAAKLAAAGLPLRTATVYTAENDPNRLFGKPGGYTSKVEFVDARTGVTLAGVTRPDPVEIGGSVEVFADASSATARVQALRQLGAAGGQLAQEFDYQQSGVVLRVSNYLTQGQAQAYGTALTALAAPAPAAPASAAPVG
jgi:hypothetical protein